MTLITRQGFTVDGWTRIELDADATETLDRRIWPFARIDEAPATGGQIGVHIANTVKVNELLPYLDRLSLISIAFPAFNDGRGFSIAMGLRHAGFRGELRAYGPLIADQFAHALGSGFDSVEVPDVLSARQPEAHWSAAEKSLSLSYQRGSFRGISILDQRRKAAEARSRHFNTAQAVNA